MSFIETLRKRHSIITSGNSPCPGLQTKAVRCHIPLGGFACFKPSSNKSASKAQRASRQQNALRVALPRSTLVIRWQRSRLLKEQSVSIQYIVSNIYTSSARLTLSPAIMRRQRLLFANAFGLRQRRTYRGACWFLRADCPCTSGGIPSGILSILAARS